MYTCVLREETNRYAARYYSTFNISGVAPSCFPSFVPFLLSPSSLPFFLSFLSNLSYSANWSRRIVSFAFFHLAKTIVWNDDPRGISNAKRNTFVYTMLWYPMKNASWPFSTSLIYTLRSKGDHASQIRVWSRESSIGKGSCSLYKYYIIFVCSYERSSRFKQ